MKLKIEKYTNPNKQTAIKFNGEDSYENNKKISKDIFPELNFFNTSLMSPYPDIYYGANRKQFSFPDFGVDMPVKEISANLQKRIVEIKAWIASLNIDLSSQEESIEIEI